VLSRRRAGWHRRAAIVEQPGDAHRRLRDRRYLDQRQHFSNACGVERVAVLAELEQQKQHVPS
jgi:hypothetical protein